MTKEEAIQTLRSISYQKELFNLWRDIEAIDMAISELSKADTTENPKCDKCIYKTMWQEQEQVDTSDLISRAGVIKIIDRHKHRFNEITYGSMINYINDLPSVSADRPNYNLELIADIVRQLGHLDSYVADTCDRQKGEWLELLNSDFWECSICGKPNLPTSYCPDCGAYMGEGREP